MRGKGRQYCQVLTEQSGDKRTVAYDSGILVIAEYSGANVLRRG